MYRFTYMETRNSTLGIIYKWKPSSGELHSRAYIAASTPSLKKKMRKEKEKMLTFRATLYKSHESIKTTNVKTINTYGQWILAVSSFARRVIPASIR